MNILSAIILALSITLGVGSAASAPVEPQASVTVAQEMSQEESEQAILAQDAQVTWTDYLDTPMTSETISYTWVAYSTQQPTKLAPTEFALQSIDLGVWHVYHAYTLETM